MGPQYGYLAAQIGMGDIERSGKDRGGYGDRRLEVPAAVELWFFLPYES